MNELARALIIAAALLSGAIVMSGTFGSDRYQLAPSAGSVVYRLDRLTGAVAICTPAFCRPLPTLVPRTAPAQAAKPAPGGAGSDAPPAAPPQAPAQASGQAT